MNNLRFVSCLIATIVVTLFSSVAVRTVTGVVRDTNGAPLEGATVMPFASPLHCNTDANGYYEVQMSDEELTLEIYYPGKDIAMVTLASTAELQKDITLSPQSRASVALPRRKALATQWYNADTYTPRTLCNPMNIGYDYECYRKFDSFLYAMRSTADPMALVYGSEYFLFATNQGGFFYSKDLTRWDFRQATFQRTPTEDDMCAPAAWTSGDTLYYVGSTYRGLPVWYTTDPHSSRWRRAVECDVLPWWDPHFLLDDDGKLYCYYGSSNSHPVKAVQVSRDDFRPVSKIQNALTLKPKKHGWERFGMNNNDVDTLDPFVEGAFMTKHAGKYYLQYGAPGTEFKVYADGVYVSDNPLGPFEYQKHNPMSYKPGGFVRGSGHGGTFKDILGNWWHTSTCMLSLGHKFERRIGMYPAGFDADGVMYSAQAYGDYPNWNATVNVADPYQRFTGWMLLSYKKKATMCGEDAPELTDESMQSYHFIEGTEAGAGEVVLDLNHPCTVRAIQLNYYDHNSTQHNKANDIYYQYRIWASLDGKNWQLVVDKSDNDYDCPHDYVELQAPLSTRYLKLENLHMATGDFCMQGFRVFGNTEGAVPAVPRHFDVKREKQDTRNSMITWDPVPGAYGYNIYYGIAPDKQYNAITVLSENSYEFRGMDVDTTYYFSIEAMNETGVSARSETIKR